MSSEPEQRPDTKHEEHHHREVVIEINKGEHKTHSGKNPVEHLKHLGYGFQINSRGLLS